MFSLKGKNNSFIQEKQGLPIASSFDFSYVDPTCRLEPAPSLKGLLAQR